MAGDGRQRHNKALRQVCHATLMASKLLPTIAVMFGQQVCQQHAGHRAKSVLRHKFGK
jgi:hypothetical protein